MKKPYRSTTPRSFEESLRTQFHRYAGMQPEDLYKLIHQASMGSEHAIKDPASARDFLDQEIAGLGEPSHEPLIETLCPENSIVRVNLRPFLLINGDVGALLEAFIETATTFPGNPDRIRRYMDTALLSARNRQIPLDPTSIQPVFSEMAMLEYPAVHHSSTYIRLYAPAYRVIQITNFPSLMHSSREGH